MNLIANGGKDQYTWTNEKWMNDPNCKIKGKKEKSMKQATWNLGRISNGLIIRN